MVSDLKGNILYVNPAFEEVTGYTRAEALGQNPRMLKSGEHDAAFYRALWDTVVSGKTWRGRLLNRAKDGTRYTEEASISPVHNASGAIVSYVAVKRDITHDLALEAQLLQSQKMEGIGRLAGGVAHDFNNLLSVVLGSAEFALESLREDDPLREELLEIQKAGLRAASLTRQLLAFSRKQVLQPKPLQLNDVVGDLEKMLRRVLGEDIDLVQDLAEDLGQITADPGQIEQVIVNLAVNSRDAMPDGGKLTITTANVDFTAGQTEAPAGAAPGPYVMVSVEDTGAGMDEETIARIFEPFFTTKEAGKGTGLGLSTVYGIVKQSGGVVDVASKPGAGTTFSVYLPREVACGPLVRSTAPATRLGGTETILVVEDDEAVRGLAKRILEAAGYTVLTAANGQEALYICERPGLTVHLVLTDVVMPEMSGRVFIEQLGKLRSELKVVYMSGYTDDAIVHHRVLDSDAHFIGKPLTRVELMRKVRDALDH
jgi:PAS domain S-box-containing protein